MIEENVKNKELQKFLDKYNTPVKIYDDTLGEFTLNRKYNHFSKEIDWLGSPCYLSLEYDGEKSEKAFSYFKSIFESLEQWDRKLKEYAAKEFSEQDGELNNSAVSEKEFCERIFISEFNIDPDGYFNAYFNDDGIFGGRTVSVNGNVNRGFDCALIEELG